MTFGCFRWMDPEMGPRAMPDCAQPLQGLVRVETIHYETIIFSVDHDLPFHQISCVITLFHLFTTINMSRWIGAMPSRLTLPPKL